MLPGIFTEVEAVDSGVTVDVCVADIKTNHVHIAVQIHNIIL